MNVSFQTRSLNFSGVPHAECMDLLAIFRNLPSAPPEFASRRQEIFHTLKNKFLNAYLNPYGFVDFSNVVREVLNSTNELLSFRRYVREKLHDLFEVVDAALRNAEKRYGFLALEGLNPFLDTAQVVLDRIESDSSERFKCSLRLRRPMPYAVERRYPLLEANRIVRVKLPLVNDGPGTAIETTAQIMSASEGILISEEIRDLGSVPPGSCGLFRSACWGAASRSPSHCGDDGLAARGTKPQVISFDVTLLAQKPDINWDALERTDPYSTEVAHGVEFVGRKQKVLALVNRLLKPRMQSSYITGQKRVGKTSLAFAMQDCLRSDGLVGDKAADTQQIEFVPLKYGDYARRTDATVETWGRYSRASYQTSSSSGPAKRAQLSRFARTIKPDRQLTVGH